jgi:hypothetical protein
VFRNAVWKRASWSTVKQRPTVDSTEHLLFQINTSHPVLRLQYLYVYSSKFSFKDAAMVIPGAKCDMIPLTVGRDGRSYYETI